MKMQKRTIGAVSAFIALLLFAAGCVGDISVDRVGFDGRLEYNSGKLKGLAPETVNIMANFSLTESYESDPLEFIMRFQTMFAREPLPEYLAAMADAALNLGIDNADTPDTAMRYYLSAAICSYAYLVGVDRPAEEPYSDTRMRLIRTYNIATGEIFDYLRRRDMHLTEGYSLTAAGGQRLTFRMPEFDLPVKLDQITDLQLCSGYRPRNLTHISRRFGIGEPIIAEVGNTLSRGDIRFAENLTIPLTLTIGFGWSDRENGKLDARMCFTDSRNRDAVAVGHYRIPLQLDYSTPLAYMVRNPLPFGYLEYMLRPDATREMQGLYLFEPYRDDRIPVVFVHGLMSDTRTWMQMINTLWNDPDIRRNYQFCGFTYSSGNPVLLSAKMLRDDLSAARKILTDGGRSTKMFDRMVLVGHSMGGLVSKTMIMDSGTQLIDGVLGKKALGALDSLTQEQRDFLRGMFVFEAYPSVKRVVFIAVPHRGSEMARRPIARLGSMLTTFPTSVIQNGEGIIGHLMERGIMLPNDTSRMTGIDNLDPDNRAMQTLTKMKFKDGVPYHSIMGNRLRGDTPGGSDGIVPYSSSHLDGATSELVVKSGHSVQQNALAIQEMRRILLLHLKDYPEMSVSGEHRQQEVRRSVMKSLELVPEQK